MIETLTLFKHECFTKLTNESSGNELCFYNSSVDYL